MSVTTTSAPSASPQLGMIELVQERTPCGKTYDLGGGRRQLLHSVQPLHAPVDVLRYKQGLPCGWADVDTGVRRHPVSGKLEVGACWYGLTLPDDAVGYDYQSVMSGGTVSVRLLEVDGQAVSVTHPPTGDPEGEGLWWKNVGPQLDFRLLARPGNIEMFKHLRGKNAGRSFLWQVTESAGQRVPLRHVSAGHDNYDLSDKKRDDTGVGRCRRQLVMNDPVVSSPTTNVDGSITYTVLESWSGNTIALDADRVPSVSSEVSYPVLIDVTVNEDVAANGDDGDQIDTAGTWENSYGSTGKHIIYDPASSSVAYYPGWRFTTVNVPNGATVNTGTLTLTLSNSSSGTGAAATVYGVASDSAPAWATNAGPVQAARTTATASFGGWGGGSTNNGTRNITCTSILQEIFNRAGWAANANLALFALYTPNNNSSFSYINDLAGGTTGVAHLTIDYTAGGGTTYTSTISDALTLTDGLLSWTRRQRSGSDVTVLSDQLLGYARRSAQVSDSLTISEQLTSWTRRQRSTQDSLTVSDELVFWRRLVRFLEDNATIVDGLVKSVTGGSGGIVYTKVMSDALELVDGLGNRWVRRTSQLTDAIDVASELLHSTLRFRSSSDAVSIAEAVIAWRRLAREGLDALEVQDGQVRYLRYSRTLTETPSIVDEVLHTYLPGVSYDVRAVTGDDDSIALWESSDAPRIADSYDYPVLGGY